MVLLFFRRLSELYEAIILYEFRPSPKSLYKLFIY
jgi:hypothetical protein